MITFKLFKESLEGEHINDHLLSHETDKHFDSKELNDAKELNTKWKSRDRFMYMPIKHFLMMAKPLKNGPYKDDAEKAFKAGIPWSDIPYLQIDHYDKDDSDDGISHAKVTGHEGRHRALVLKDHGYTHMPVILETHNIRWSEQDNPNKFDYKDDWPEYIKSETGDNTIPFPIKRKAP